METKRDFKKIDRQVLKKHIRALVVLLIIFFLIGMFWNIYGPIAFWHETGHVIGGWMVGVFVFWSGPRTAAILTEIKTGFQDEVLANAGYFGAILFLFALTLLCLKYGANILAFYYWGQYHGAILSTGEYGFRHEHVNNPVLSHHIFLWIAIPVMAFGWVMFLGLVIHNVKTNKPTILGVWMNKTMRHGTGKYRIKYPRVPQAKEKEREF